jgi:hypothetical protein
MQKKLKQCSPTNVLLEVVGSNCINEQSRRVALPKGLIVRLPVQLSQLDEVLEACSREFEACSHEFCVRIDSRRECKVRSNSRESLSFFLSQDDEECFI